MWDPGLVKQLFTGDSDVLHAGEANARVLGRVAPSSLLGLDGARHVRMRRLLSPPFHGEAVRKNWQLIGELAAAEVQRWPVGEEFAIYPRMQAIALEVILRAVIGVRDQARMARLRSCCLRWRGQVRSRLLLRHAIRVWPRVDRRPVAVGAGTPRGRRAAL